jgi:hypothetical protein
MGMVIRVYTKRITGTVDRDGANTAAARVGLIEVTDVCRKILNQATVNAPVDTGFLRAQHSMTVKTLRTRVKGEVVNRAKYAAAVHDGSKAHIIRARKKKALRFEVGGKVVFARSVRHPGSRGRPWLADAAERVSATAGFRFQRTVVSE